MIIKIRKNNNNFTTFASGKFFDYRTTYDITYLN